MKRIFQINSSIRTYLNFEELTVRIDRDLCLDEMADDELTYIRVSRPNSLRCGFEIKNQLASAYVCM